METEVLTEKEIKEAKEALLGVRVWFIIEVVMYGIGTLTLLVISIVIPIILAQSTGEPIAVWASAGGFLIGIIVVAAFLILYIVALNGILKKKNYSFTFGMAMLIISMFWIPVGTIVGAILLTRYNTQLVRKYLGFNR